MKPFIRKSSALQHSRIFGLHGCARKKRGRPSNASMFDEAPLQLCSHFPQRSHLVWFMLISVDFYFYFLGITGNISSNPESWLVHNKHPNLDDSLWSGFTSRICTVVTDTVLLFYDWHIMYVKMANRRHSWQRNWPIRVVHNSWHHIH